MINVHKIKRLHKKYAPNEQVFNHVYSHCAIVAEIAEWCVNNADIQDVDKELLQAACLLHDIGTYVYFTDDAHIMNERLYPQHAVFGAGLLRGEGLPEIADLVETHVLLGLSKKEILEKPWPLPARDYVPETIEGRLLCYADRFHSKNPTFNDFESFADRLQKDLPEQAEKFRAWSKEFGIPDVAALAKKYNQPIR